MYEEKYHNTIENSAQCSKPTCALQQPESQVVQPSSEILLFSGHVERCTWFPPPICQFATVKTFSLFIGILTGI